MRALTCLAALAIASAPVAAVTAANTPQATGFATFIQPDGWTLSGDAKGMTLRPEEGDFDMAVVDVPGAPSADAAVAAAWQRQYPGFARKLQMAAATPAKDGWDESKAFAYETTPNERQFVQAIANRRGANWTVLLLKGNMGTFQKRGGSAYVTLGSLRPVGYVRESFAGRAPHPIDAARLAALQQFVTTAMADLRIPGVSMAIIDRGKLIFAGGFGVRELGKPEKVDADTLFMIASNTKGMTTLMLAKEVDEGRFKWTDKVTSVYPTFKLGNPETTDRVEMRHLVCACTGMPRRDIPDGFTARMNTPAAATFAQLAATQPTSKFGEGFQYSNTMAAAAGFVGGHAAFPRMEAGAAYDRAMQEKVFAPLGMTHTTFDWKRALRADHASPHGTDITGALAVGNIDINRSTYASRPAGAAWSSANDLIRYVDNELREGLLPNGQRYISAQNVLARRLPSVPVGADGFYGMGLMGRKTADIDWFHHGGSLIGYRSDIYFLPAAGFGAVVLTNSESGELMLEPFMRRVLEILYDGKPEAAAAVAAAAGPSALDALRKSLTWPADPKIAATIAPRYVSPDLGVATFSRKDGKLWLSNGVWTVPMATKVNADGTVSLVTADVGFTGIDFVITNDGGRRGLVIRDGQHEYRFMEAE